MEDEEVGEGVGEEEGQADEEEEAVGESRDGGAGGRDGEEGRDAGCFLRISQLLLGLIDCSVGILGKRMRR